ncbi:MAG TPA: hypothetical protein DCS66_15385 [Flavobacteriaceae bacterium]|nr:hypothetical protein [Flavobacteriaceae bacterium]|tara:strand:- start:543 stop:761 length:219 start_codon:yes stop_codon:yes gene_type:complete
MSTKYFCDDCGKEMILNKIPDHVDNGTDWVAFMHDQGIETIIHDRIRGESTRDHQCKSCHIKEQGEESYYNA